MAPSGKEPWDKAPPEREPWDQKVPLGAKVGLTILRGVGGIADRLGKGKGKKCATTISFGSGGPHITREAYPDEWTFLFKVLGCAGTEGRGTAVYGMIVRGTVRAGDTVTCVTAGGQRFPCTIQDVERFPAGGPSGGPERSAAAPPFCTLFVSGYGPEAFHPQDKFYISKEIEP